MISRAPTSAESWYTLAAILCAISIPSVAAADTGNWRVANDLGTDGMSFCLVGENDQWTWQQECDPEKQPTAERVFVSQGQKVIWLGAGQPTSKAESNLEKQRKRQYGPNGTYECFYGVFGASDREKNGYTICSSAFAESRTGAGEAVVGNLFNVVVGTTRLRKGVNMVALLEAADKSGLLAHLDQAAADKARAAKDQAYAEYRQAFETASTSVDFLRFIKKYSKEDPDGLVPLAKEKMQFAAACEEKEDKARRYEDYKRQFNEGKTALDMENFIQQYSQNDPDGLVPKAMKKRDALACQEETAERQRREKTLAQIRSFQKTLHTGMETNCGPVVELKPPLAKIYFPVPNYGNEHWLRIDELYPPWATGCRFVNGRYQPPEGSYIAERNRELLIRGVDRLLGNPH